MSPAEIAKAARRLTAYKRDILLDHLTSANGALPVPFGREDRYALSQTKGLVRKGLLFFRGDESVITAAGREIADRIVQESAAIVDRFGGSTRENRAP